MSTTDENSEQQLKSTPNSTDLPSKKRKRAAVEDSKTNTTSKTIPTPKSKKPKTKKAKVAEEDEDLDEENHLNLAISRMDPQLLSDYMASKTRKFESDLSAIELADKYIPAICIKDTSCFETLRKDGELPAFMERFATCGAKKLWGSSKMLGSPHTIIVAGAGLRAAELARVLRPYSTEAATIAKLFAKHIKIGEQIAFLKRRRTGIAVGTPQRLDDLMSEGTLNTTKLERIIIDASHIDIKKRGILEMKDTNLQLMKWLTRKEFKARFAGDTGAQKEKMPKLELLFY